MNITGLAQHELIMQEEEEAAAFAAMSAALLPLVTVS